MKRLNIKFLIPFLAVAVVLAVVVYFRHGTQVEKTEQMWLDQSAKAIEDGRERDALDDLKKYLKANPEDLEREQEAARLAASIFLNTSRTLENFVEARGLLEKSVRATRDPEIRRELERLLIEVLRDAGRTSEAYDLIREHLEATPEDAQLTYWAAECAIRLKKESQGERPDDYLTRIIGFVPGNVEREEVPRWEEEKALDIRDVESFALLAEYYRAIRGDNDNADAVIEGMIDFNGKLDGSETRRKTASLAWHRRGVYRALYQSDSGTQKEIDDAKTEVRKEFARALEYDPQNENALLALSELHMEDGDIEGARKRLLEAINGEEPSANAFLGLAHLEWRARDRDAAFAALDAGLNRKDLEKDLRLHFRKCRYLLIDRQGEGMKEAIREMVRHELPQVYIRVARALLPICDFKWNEAAKALEAVQAQVSNVPLLNALVLQNRAECYSRLEEWDRSLEMYRALADTTGLAGTDELLSGHLMTLIKLQRMEDAEALLLRRPGKLEDAPPDIYALAQLIAQWKRRNQLAETAAPDPGQGDEGTLAVSNEPVEGDIEQWIEEDNFWDRVGQQSRYLIENEEGDKAIALVKDALVRYDKYVESLPDDEVLEQREKDNRRGLWANNYYAYIGMIVDQKEGEAGVALALSELEALQDKRGDTPRNVIESARVLARPGDKAAREAVRTLESRIAQFDEAQQAKVWVELGLIYLRTGVAGISESKRCWTNAATLSPSDKPTLQQLFELARRSRDEAGMIEAIERIRAAVGEKDPLWKYATAHYLISSEVRGETSHAELEEALQLVEEAITVRRNWASLYELRGLINERINDPESALRDFEQARVRGLKNVRLLSRIIEMRIQRGEYAEAQRVLRAVGPNFPGLDRLRVYIQIARGADRDRVLSALRDYQQETDDWKAHLEKAELARRAARRFLNDPESLDAFHQLAEDEYRAAVRKASDIPQTWLSLISFLASSKKDLPSAETVLREAETRLPDDQARYVMAQGYMYVQDFAQAEHYLRAILAGDPDNLQIKRTLADYYLRTRQNAKAIEELNQIIDSQGTGAERDFTDILWARRQLASLLANTGGHQAFLEALKLLEDNQSLKPTSIPDAQLKAQLLARRSEPRYKREALTLLDFIYQTDPSFLSFRSAYILANLYYRDSSLSEDERWRKVTRVMDLLLDEERARSEGRTDAQRAQVLELYASMLLDRGDTAGAGAHIRRLVQLQPESAQGVRLLAKWHLARRERQAAIDAIARLAPPSPLTLENAPVLLFVARLFDEQGVKDRALAAFERLAEEHPTGRIHLAEYYARHDQSRKAVQIGEDIMAKKDPQEMFTACQIGVIIVRNLSRETDGRQAMVDKVGEWFRRTEELERNRERRLRLRLLEADYSIIINDNSRALAIFDELSQRRDITEFEQGQIANNLAYLLAARGEDLDRADELVQRAMRLVGPNAGVLDTKGIVHLARQECKKSVQAIEEALSMRAAGMGFEQHVRGDEATWAQMYFHLALAYQCADNRTEAARAWKQAQNYGFTVEAMRPLQPETHTKLVEWLGSAASEVTPAVSAN
ncbi:MAG: hypothetical protein DWQ35_19565 [Planctomycetota bacterium]|nr:MAG: hypothetical protein DWQ35_19565 [Planctomycetota bacterium]